MDLSFYVITLEVPDLKRSHLEVAKAAIEGGATVIQFREKNKTSCELIEMAREVHKITQTANIPLIINDRLDVAQAIGAEGVHLGQKDMPVKVARRILGPDCIIGMSCGNIEEALEAVCDGVTYIGVGPVFPTSTKEDAREPIGIEGLIKVRKRVSIPVVAIGGISIENIESVIEAGADGVAVISAVAFSSDMKAASCSLSKKIKRVKEAKYGLK